MRFDTAINRMTLQAFETGVLPLMRDGKQWRTWVHVRDAVDAICHLLGSERSSINGEIYNIGSDACTIQLKPLAEMVARIVPRQVEIEFYGDPDTRSYRASFARSKRSVSRRHAVSRTGVREICEALRRGAVDCSERTINLTWYQRLEDEARRTASLQGRESIFEVDDTGLR